MTVLNLLIIGHTERAEAKPLVEWLGRALRPAVQRYHRHLAAALEAISPSHTIPDLIVIVQSQPDEFSSVEIASLFAFAPLARLVVAYGAWCESDGRTRNVWPLAVRVSLPNAASRIEREWRLLHEERGIEPLPLSASREEVFAADHRLSEETVSFEQLTTRPTASRQTVLVVSPDPAYRRYLHELLVVAGHEACKGIAPEVDSHPTAVLFDADPWTAAIVERVRSLKQQHPATKLIALMSLAHPDHTAELTAAGAAAVQVKLGNQAAIIAALEVA